MTSPADMVKLILLAWVFVLSLRNFYREPSEIGWLVASCLAVGWLGDALPSALTHE